MNKLEHSKQLDVLRRLIDGHSVQSTAQQVGVSVNTAIKLLMTVGQACTRFQATTVNALITQRIYCNTIEGVFDRRKMASCLSKSGFSNTSTMWTALDLDTKLIIAWHIGEKDPDTAADFVKNVVSKVTNDLQQVTDNSKRYLIAVDEVKTDSHQNVKEKNMVSPVTEVNELSREERIRIESSQLLGESRLPFSADNIDPNLAMSMYKDRKEAYSKKQATFSSSIALHFVHYNFIKIHKTLLVPPALEARLIKRIMNIEDLLRLPT